MKSRPVDSAQTAPGVDGGPPLGQMILRRKWLLLFGLALGAGLGYLYFTQQPPVYQSGVRILVSQNRPPLGAEPGQSGASAATDLATQCVALTSEVVLISAVDNFGLAEKEEFGSREMALAKLAIGLSASPVQMDRTNTDVIQVSYRGASPAECRLALAAVMQAYKNFLGQSERAISEDTADLVKQASGQLMTELDALESEYAAFRAELPLLGQGENTVNPYSVRLAEVHAQLTGLIVQRSALDAKIAAVKEALEKGGSREALTLMVDQLREAGDGKSETISVAEKLFPLLLEKELLTENLGPDHPKVQSIERQIRLTREHLNNLLDASGAGDGPKDLLGVYIASLQYELETIRVQEEKLNKIYDEVSGNAKQLESVMSRDRQMTHEIERKSKMLDVIAKKLDEMSLFNSQGIRIQAMAEPGPGARTPVKRNEFMIIGGVLGFVLAAGLAYMMEASDKSFRTAEDIRDEIGAPVLGHVPVISGKPAADFAQLAPVLSTVHLPKGSSAEAFRLVRTALFFGARGGNLKVIQVTSPDQGDGKSTVAANLAVAIAHSGRPTLLIDADLRRPTVHSLFGIDGGPGLAGTIAGAADPDDAILESGVPNLSLLPCGMRPHNPAELLADPGFEQLLDWARDRYDFIIVDTPPLLAVSDPGNVACRVDAVLLTLRLDKRTRAKAIEARDILDRVGANVLGIVINGVNAKGDYGYQAGYHYTNSSTYGYRYGTYGGNSRYLEEEGRRSDIPLGGNAVGNRRAKTMTSDV